MNNELKEFLYTLMMSTVYLLMIVSFAFFVFIAIYQSYWWAISLPVLVALFNMLINLTQEYFDNI